MNSHLQEIIVESDEWLAGMFGHGVFRVPFPVPPAAKGIALASWMEQCRGQPAFGYAKVPTHRVDVVQALSRAGFVVVDVNVTLERPAVSGADASVPVRDATAADQEHVLDVAGSCYVYSRFHLDPRVPNELAHRIKREWVRNYFLGKRGERLLTVHSDGRAVGFLAVVATTMEGRAVRIIDLIGVDRAHQGQGLGKALVQSFVNTYAGKCDLLRVGTQVANVPSLRLYDQCGFRIAESAYVLHAHWPTENRPA